MAASKLAVLSQTCAASRESNIELLILVSDFMVSSTLKSTQMYCFNEDPKEKKKKRKDISSTSWVGMIKSPPVPK